MLKFIAVAAGMVISAPAAYRIRPTTMPDLNENLRMTSAAGIAMVA
jgi:hypothetical protein